MFSGEQWNACPIYRMHGAYRLSAYFILKSKYCLLCSQILVVCNFPPSEITFHSIQNRQYYCCKYLDLQYFRNADEMLTISVLNNKCFQTLFFYCHYENDLLLLFTNPYFNDFITYTVLTLLTYSTKQSPSWEANQ